MKKLCVLAMLIVPSIGWTMTEQQAIENWKAACTEADSEYDVDFIQSFNGKKSLHVLYICQRTDGSQTVRIVPAPHLESDEPS
ncbi:hypothetical protein [Ruegeria sp. MALMAid1280]|uniref:hypothetical protein n=1 Tax=Ruegeria sp. MALMAid1280 TaxID=3411634 RepID=UPI003B9EEEAC